METSDLTSLLPSWFHPSWELDWTLVPTALVPLLVFLLRSTDVTLATLRVLSLVHHRGALAWVAGFVQALLFVLAVSGVLTFLHSPIHVVAFAAGLATGNVLGIVLEARLAPGHSLLRVISSRHGAEIANSLRAQGFGATEITGKGMLGSVTVVLSNVPRRDVQRVTQYVIGVDPQAFVAAEDARQLKGGWHA